MLYLSGAIVAIVFWPVTVAIGMVLIVKKYWT